MRRTRWLVGMAFMLLAGMAGYLWLKAPYAQHEARVVALAFMSLLQQERMEQAYDLTFKRQGELSEFRDFAKRQLCTRSPMRLAWFHPPQSNGNRLRRWLHGRQLEMESLTARFEGDCLISVELRLDDMGRWRVHSFQSTAG